MKESFILSILFIPVDFVLVFFFIPCFGSQAVRETR